MKKRSLIASIAMLLVSAIVLSTSTYAWFSAGAAVSVEKITASVQKTDGSILISATGAENTWGYTLETATITALFNNASETDYVNPTSLVPVSVMPGTAISGADGTFDNASGTGTAFSMVKGTFTSDFLDHDGDESATTEDIPVYKLVTGTANDDTAGKYLTYKFYIKADAACSVTLTPTFTTGKNFVLGSVEVDSKTYVYSNANTISYKPVKASISGVYDVNKDGIISDGNYDHSDPTGTGVGDNIATINPVGSSILYDEVKTLGGTSNITLTYAAAGTKTITVKIWAEGQQASCAGACEASTATFSFAATRANA